MKVVASMYFFQNIWILFIFQTAAHAPSRGMRNKLVITTGQSFSVFCLVFGGLGSLQNFTELQFDEQK